MALTYDPTTKDAKTFNMTLNMTMSVAENSILFLKHLYLCVCCMCVWCRGGGGGGGVGGGWVVVVGWGAR